MTPTNATDRNVTQATGMFRGHITLPSSFLTFGLLIICGSFLFVTRWCFDEVNSIRERLREHERVIFTYVEKSAPAATPAPITPESAAEPMPSATPPIIVLPRTTPQSQRKK